MDREYQGNTLYSTVRMAIKGEAFADPSESPEIEKKLGVFSVWAPPLSWGPWAEIWRQFGVTGPDRDTHVVIVGISFETVSDAASAFGVEIRGGDSFIHTTGPGSEVVTVSGNVATAISIRCKSFSVGQNISVYVR